MRLRYLVMVISVLVRFLWVWTKGPVARIGETIRLSGRVQRYEAFIGNRYRLLIGGHVVEGSGETGWIEGQRVVVVGTVRSIDHGGRLVVTSDLIMPDAEISIPFRYNLIRRIDSKFAAGFTQDQAALFSGVLVGSKRALSGSLRQALLVTGLTHVVVASGTNTAWVGAAVVGAMTILVGRRMAFAIASLGLWGFASVAGLGAPVVRAAIMGSVAYLALAAGWMVRSIEVFILTVWLMLLYNPLFIFDISFQLSAAATLAVLLAMKGKRVGGNWGETWVSLRSVVLAQLFTAPFVYLTFGRLEFTWAVICANLILLPVVPWIMVSGVCYLALSTILPAGGIGGWLLGYVAWVCALPAEVFLRVVGVLAAWVR